MMSGGGIWTVAVGVALGFGYAKVFGAPRHVYLTILAVALGVIVSSQLFLSQTHPFYQSVQGDLIFLFWMAYLAIPVGIYTLFVRWARRKAEARDDS